MSSLLEGQEEAAVAGTEWMGCDGQVTEPSGASNPRGPKDIKSTGWFGGGENSWYVLKRSSAFCVVNRLSRGRSGIDEDQVAVAIIRKQVTVAWARVVIVDLYFESRACRI